jgi:hypothetical protein
MPEPQTEPTPPKWLPRLCTAVFVSFCAVWILYGTGPKAQQPDLGRIYAVHNLRGPTAYVAHFQIEILHVLCGAMFALFILYALALRLSAPPAPPSQ